MSNKVSKTASIPFHLRDERLEHLLQCFDQEKRENVFEMHYLIVNSFNRSGTIPKPTHFYGSTSRFNWGYCQFR